MYYCDFEIVIVVRCQLLVACRVYIANLDKSWNCAYDNLFALSVLFKSVACMFAFRLESKKAL